MMLPDSPQNLVVVRAPSPSVHYVPMGTNGDHVILPSPSPTQQSIHSVNQPVSESWCITSVKVIKVKTVLIRSFQMFEMFFFSSLVFV